MSIALLSIGTEILLGDTINTNLSSLGQKLYNNGFILNAETTVPDSREKIKYELEKLLSMNEVVITCGGIGPTEDDFTKEVIADHFGLNMKIDQDHLKWMKSRWASRGLEMPETNIKQAEVPEGAIKLINTVGTAPGLLLQQNKKTIFILPGPPREFNALVDSEVVPYLKQNYHSTNKEFGFVLFFNLTESGLAQEINKFKPSGIDIAYLASRGVIKLRFDRNSVETETLNVFLENIKNNFNENVLAYENISPSKVLLNTLKNKNLTLSIVESITGGSLSSEIIKNPGSSKQILASNVLYTSNAKQKFLETNISDDWEILTAQLAEKSLKLYNSDLSIAVLGEAGPIPSSSYKIGEIFISIAKNNKTINLRHKLQGDREDIINRSVNNAIWDLINFIK